MSLSHILIAGATLSRPVADPRRASVRIGAHAPLRSSRFDRVCFLTACRTTTRASSSIPTQNFVVFLVVFPGLRGGLSSTGTKTLRPQHSFEFTSAPISVTSSFEVFVGQTRRCRSHCGRAILARRRQSLCSHDMSQPAIGLYSSLALFAALATPTDALEEIQRQLPT